MLSDIQRSALRAAAKLAFSATVFGCSATAGDPAEGEKTSDTTADLRSAAHDEQCCKEIVHHAFPDAGGFTSPPPQVSHEVKNCCSVLAKAADKRIAAGDPNGWSWPERSECCSVLGWQGAATCTPWGPAVPPAMPNLRQDVA